MANDADIIRKLQAEIAKAGSLRAWARQNGMSPAYISNVMTGQRGISERLAAALGYRRHAGWEKMEVKEAH